MQPDAPVLVVDAGDNDHRSTGAGTYLGNSSMAVFACLAEPIAERNKKERAQKSVIIRGNQTIYKV